MKGAGEVEDWKVIFWLFVVGEGGIVIRCGRGILIYLQFFFAGREGLDCVVFLFCLESDDRRRRCAELEDLVIV